MPKKSAKITMVMDKETKGAKRFSDQGTPYAHTLYFRNEEVAKLGDPKEIVVTIEPK